MREPWVGFLGREDPLREEMATYLQSSHQDNPMDQAALWATVHGVAKSQMRLSRQACAILRSK